jgi:hypothetical protein
VSLNSPFLSSLFVEQSTPSLRRKVLSLKFPDQWLRQLFPTYISGARRDSVTCHCTCRSSHPHRDPLQGWFSKKELRCKGAVIWSVIAFVAIVYSHTSHATRPWILERHAWLAGRSWTTYRGPHHPSSRHPVPSCRNWRGCSLRLCSRT